MSDDSSRSAVADDDSKPKPSPTAGPQRNNWRLALAFLAAAIALLVWAFYPTAASIVSAWGSSEAFTHGYLIIPISLWLVWDKRHGLRWLTPRPTALPLLVFLPLGFGWLWGDLANVVLMQQLTFVGMLTVSVWIGLGHHVARHLAFPLLFLFLVVPIGEGLIPPMILFTANFTVGMLELTGIPVVQEGTFFTIPTGRWSVIETCSGFSYLSASVTVGVLFAYMIYTRWWKRVLFVLFSIALPILANGLRAYAIVMIGHLSDMKLAVGVDHLIYGWIFFGVMLVVMFAIGILWADPSPPPRTPIVETVPPTSPQQVGRLFAWFVSAACVWPALAWVATA